MEHRHVWLFSWRGDFVYIRTCITCLHWEYV